MTTTYVCIALFAASLCIAHELDPKHMLRATLFAMLVAIAWPITFGVVLRSMLLTWRARRELRGRARKFSA